MAVIRSFRAWKPATATLAAACACRPYDVLNAEEARREAAGNPHSFYHITKSEIDFSPAADPYSEAVYTQARDTFRSWAAAQIFVRENKAALYLYRLRMAQHEQTGLLALSSIDDYFNDIIKKHEFTRPEKELDRIRHIDTTGLQAEPLFFAYRRHATLDAYFEKWKQQHAPVYDFTADDGIQHTLWVIDDAELIQQIESTFEHEIPYTYIADGHHRAASAAKVGKQRAADNPQHNGTEPYNFFMTVLFPDNQLHIMDYNRVVKDLNGKSEAEFLEALAVNFDIKKQSETAFYPQNPYEYSLYLGKKWYLLAFKQQQLIPTDAVGSLEIQVLSDFLLRDILGISDQRTDRRIDFVGGIRGLEELSKRVNSGEMKAAFAIRPVTMQQLFAVADSGEVMPPKSTWFEPKLRSGLAVHKFDEGW
ncbi:MAG: DUF1015 domain-containing protein [Sphingobacteriales bacterium]|nr:DUF1015 domain-containing protein [Sphingobacteriales bacterium]